MSDLVASLPPADADFTVAAAVPLERMLVRGGADVAQAAGLATGCAWPQRPCTSCETATLSVLWLGPDEWLVLAAPGLMPDLSPALHGLPHSLVDISHRQSALEMSGRLAARVLNAGCPLDLRDAAFPTGMVTRTLFQKAEIVLWRRRPDLFHVEIWRSFLPYVVGHIAAARHGLAGL